MIRKTDISNFSKAVHQHDMTNVEMRVIRAIAIIVIVTIHACVSIIVKV